jgi:hypothetical protein
VHNEFVGGVILTSQAFVNEPSGCRSSPVWDRVTKGQTRVLQKNGSLKIRPDRGQLRRKYPEPKWLNDPSHRGKTLSGDLRLLEKQPLAVSKGVNKVDCIKLQRNFGYMVKQLKESPESEWLDRGKAVLEHHFENHVHCGSWCRRKQLSVTKLEEDCRKPGKYYRCKVRDAVVYSVLKSIVDKYVVLDRLKEVAHGFSTQKNESTNNTVAWFAQKNKSLSGSVSLSNRIYLAVGIASVGYEPYVSELLSRMGIEMTEGMSKHLNSLWSHKKRVAALHKKKSFKLERHKKKKAKMESEMKLAEKKRRRDGFYKPGEGFNLCIPIVDPQQKLCRAGCGGTDHLTKQSAKCRFNLKRQFDTAIRSKEEADRKIEELLARIAEIESEYKLWVEIPNKHHC